LNKLLNNKSKLMSYRSIDALSELCYCNIMFLVLL